MTCSFGYGLSASLSRASESVFPLSPTSISSTRNADRRIFPSRRVTPRVKLRRVYQRENGGDGGCGGLGGGGGGGGSGDGAYGKASGVGLFGSLWARYMESLDEHPLIVKSLTAGAFNLFADFICQIFVDKVQQIDIQRVLSFTAIGLFMSGPGLHIWYGLLPKVIAVPGILGVLLRLAADQVILTPLGVGCYFIAVCTLEGRRHEITMKLQKDWLPVVIANWKVWFPFQLINFGLVPLQLQVAAASLLGMIWSIFISFVGHN